ncbi:MAG: amidohydrolase [Sphingobacteriales bacterium]|nr:MAG: amidohydrolase [Sphingobacteriales bacterium]
MQLNISVIQPDIFWEDKQANFAQYEKLITGIADKKEVVVLPEMFSTGFSMAPEKLAEGMNGESVQWMKTMAAKNRCILTGSLIIEEDGNYYNRLLWVQPDGKIWHYDKRHLFGYANEDHHYSPGSKRLIVQVKGFKICLLVCYDLRFPIWARNKDEEYDVLIYVANWPERRNLAWKTLLQARAIENQSYVVGVNRVGIDGKDIKYSGDSSVFGPLGEPIWQNIGEVTTHTVTLKKEHLTEIRGQFPFLKDADKYLILDQQ